MKLDVKISLHFFIFFSAAPLQVQLFSKGGLYAKNEPVTFLKVLGDLAQHVTNLQHLKRNEHCANVQKHWKDQSIWHAAVKRTLKTLHN